MKSVLDSKAIKGFNASHWGQIAQSVEQRIENPRVGGSIPSLATMISLVKSWCYQVLNFPIKKAFFIVGL